MKALPVKVTNNTKSLLVIRAFKDPLGEAVLASGETLTFEFRDLAHDFKERIEALGATVVIQAEEQKPVEPTKPETTKKPVKVEQVVQKSEEKQQPVEAKVNTEVQKDVKDNKDTKDAKSK